VGSDYFGHEYEDADVIVFVRQVVPHQSPDELRRARAAGQIVIADMDDTLFPDDKIPMTQDSLAAVEQSTGELPEVDLRDLFGSLSAFTVSTEAIAREVRSISPTLRVKVIRNAVDTHSWRVEDVSGPPVLGWPAFLRLRAGDHEVLSPWLGRFVEEHDLRFVHVGHRSDDSRGRLASVLDIDPERVEERPVVPFWDYIGSRPLHGINIGLVPLADRPHNQAKSALKGLEFAASGIPFVASPSDEYRRLGFGTLAGSSLAVQSEHEWRTALEPMLDPVERAWRANDVLTAAGAEDIRNRWCDWEALYESLGVERVAA
jgi:hypothetical protein